MGHIRDSSWGIVIFLFLISHIHLLLKDYIKKFLKKRKCLKAYEKNCEQIQSYLTIPNDQSNSIKYQKGI